MAIWQKTVQNSFSLTGIGLHSGQEVTITVQPAPVDTGILFIRQDLPARPPILAHMSQLSSKTRRTCLMAQDAEVYTTEHFLAVCLALGITNLRVAIGGPEVPGMDGSALPFYEAFHKAGLQAQTNKAKTLTITKELQVAQDKATITVWPYPDRLRLEYTLDHDMVSFPPQSLALDLDESIFAKEIAPARTFVLKQEVEALRRMGLGKGANTHNTLVIDEQGKVLDTTLRFPDEFVRHKILDLLGDLALVGRPIHARICALRSGHQLNARLAQELGRLD